MADILKKVRRQERYEYIGIGLAVALVVALGGYLATSALSSYWIVLGWALTLLCGVFGFWKVPDLLFGEWMKRRRWNRFERQCSGVGIKASDERFEVDMDTSEIRSKT